jgi:hypothetical protein
MTTTIRQEIEQNYRISATGHIQSPGKFEGQMIYVPYFWEASLDGGPDDYDDDALLFDVTAEDRALFPEIPVKTEIIRLIETEQGFVEEC